MSDTQNQQDYHILSIECDQSQTETFSQWIAEQYDVSPVELERPGQFIIWLEVYFLTKAEAQEAGEAFEEAQGHKRWAVRHCAHRDWTEFWKRHFTPREIGQRLWLVPPWIEEEKAGRERIEINPGLSFGTGEHFTTRFCLEQVDRWLTEKPGCSILDLGCGSGVLAIAAARLGASPILAVDHDPICVRQTAENADINGVPGKIEVREMDLLVNWVEGEWDVVFANIYGPVLIDLAASIVRATKEVIVLSGVREIEADVVAQTFIQYGVKEVAREGERGGGGMTFMR